MSRAQASGIGTLHESTLHAALKAYYADPGDSVEVPVDRYVVDVLKGNGARVVEVQTRNFASIKRKVTRLLRTREVLLVHPVARAKWIVRESVDGTRVLGRRKSPKRQSYLHLFEELVSIPHLVAHPRFALEVVLVTVDEVRRQVGRARARARVRAKVPARGRSRGRFKDRSRGRGKGCRPGWRVVDRRLLDIEAQRRFTGPADFRAFLPGTLAEPFTSLAYARAAGCTRRLAQKALYCLRGMGVVHVAGKQGNAYLHVRA